MEVEIKTTQTLNVKYIEFDIPIYKGDITFNEDDSEIGRNIEENERLNLKIDIDEGKVLHWEDSNIKHNFSIYAKPIDEGTYKLYDENFKEIVEYNGYVPSILSCIDEGYGDYLSMIIYPDGTIENWDPYKLNKFIDTINEEY